MKIYLEYDTGLAKASVGHNYCKTLRYKKPLYNNTQFNIIIFVMVNNKT